MKWIVYCTTCLVNGKIYIGVHKTENPDVFDGYYGNGIEKGWVLKNPKTAFQRALKKYGYANFRRCTLCVFDNEVDAYTMEASIVNTDFVKRRDNYNTCLGGAHPGPAGKWIYRYHLDGTFWEEAFCIKEYAEKLGTTPISLREACQYKRSYKNSFWSFDKLDKLDLSEFRINNLENPIYQFDVNGEFLKQWDSAKDICEYYDIAKSNLYSGLYKKTMVKDFYFLHDKAIIHDILKSKTLLPKVAPGTTVKMLQYDLDGNLIKEWDSIKECAKHYSKCRDVAKGLRKQTKNCIFVYKS